MCYRIRWLLISYARNHHILANQSTILLHSCKTKKSFIKSLQNKESYIKSLQTKDSSITYLQSKQFYHILAKQTTVTIKLKSHVDMLVLKPPAPFSCSQFLAFGSVQYLLGSVKLNKTD